MIRWWSDIATVELGYCNFKTWIVVMKINTIISASILLASGQVGAALFSRLAGQAYYDDAADLTWMADAN